MGGSVGENGGVWSNGGTSAIEPPHSIAQARVDDKGRLKLPAEFWEYLKQVGADKVFITTVDLQLARIYPIPLWKSNENLFANAGELAELAGDVAYIAKYFGGDSEIDAQGRVLLPAALRKQLNLESQPVWLDCYNGGINVAGKAIHEERFHRAMANFSEKSKTLATKGLK
jgi:MraZ protein